MNEYASVIFLFGLLCANYQKLGFNILWCDKLYKIMNCGTMSAYK